jgi:hypothetical protein
VTDRVDLPKQLMDDFARCWESWAGLPKFLEMVGLNLEQAGFYGRGARRNRLNATPVHARLRTAHHSRQ